MAVMRAAGAAWTRGASWIAGTARCTRCSWQTGAARTRRAGTAIGKRRLEDALQLGGLIAGQLATGHFARDQVVDLGLQISGRRGCAAARTARAAALQRGVDAVHR